MFRKLSYVVMMVAVFAILIRPFIYKPYFIDVKPCKEEVVTVVPKPKPKEKPLHDVKLPDFANISDIKTKKTAFFEFLRPAVDSQNALILAKRADVKLMLSQVSLDEPLSAEQLQLLAKLAKSYRVNKQASQMQQLHELMAKVDEIPSALVLVQAANESAWGTSRFARIGLNFFGIWCYKKGCGMVPRSRNHGASHEVEAFSSIDEAVKRYLHNINTNNAYAVFRTIRQQLREQEQPLTPQILATGLLPYSERGSDYVIEITDMLRHNSRYLINQPIGSIQASP